MAEEEKGKDKDGEAQAEAAPAKGSKKKLILIIAGVVVLLLAAGIPIVMLSLKPKEAPENSQLAPDAASAVSDEESSLHPEGAEDEDELTEGEEAMGGIFPLDTFVVNLSGGHYIRVQMQLEFAEREIPKRFYTKIVPIRDGVIGLLAARTSDDFSAPKGRDQLKTDVKELVNELLRKQDVKRVYFTQFVIQ